MTSSRYPCPCCGYLTYEQPAGSFEICPICFWEDDIFQLMHPDDAGGANHSSLRESQQNYQRLGACEARLIVYTRPPTEDDVRDPQWRPIDNARDTFTTPRWQVMRPYKGENRYYWQTDYWLVHINTPIRRRLFHLSEAITAIVNGRLLRFYISFWRTRF